MSTRTQVAAKAPAFTLARAGLLKRKCACGGSHDLIARCDECREKSLNLRRYATNHAEPTNVPALPAIVREVLHSAGRPLDAETRAFMEPRFGHDFSRVRVHTDATAAESARTLDAQAYTIGQSLVFASGRYSPTTREGKWLLAHELAHTAQQELYAPHRKTLVSQPTDSSELEADRLTQQVMLDLPASPKRRQSRVGIGAMILRYRAGKEPFFGRENEPARGLVEETFSDRENQPWIERITVTFDGWAVDSNSQLARIPAANRLMSTGKLEATYHANRAAKPPIRCDVGGGSAILGLTDAGDFRVQRIEGVGYNAALEPGQRPAEPRIPGTKYTRDPTPTSPTFPGTATMHYAVFFQKKPPQALHIGRNGLTTGSHSCVHVENPPIKQINYHSVVHDTKVSVSYSSAAALHEVCCARLRETGIRRPPCESVTCP
jgi:hypothetical protein